MRQSRAFLYGKSSGGVLQEACTFYTRLDYYFNDTLTVDKGGFQLERSRSGNVSGLIGQALYVDNDSNRVLFNTDVNSDGLNLTDANGSLDYSISLWINRVASSDSNLFEFGSNSSLGSVSVGVNSTSINFYHIGRDLNFNRALLRKRLSYSGLNQWDHFVFVFNSQSHNISAYINGVLTTGSFFDTSNYTTIDTYQNSSVFLGSSFNFSYISKKTLLDEFAYFKNHMLTQEQVDILYNNGNGIQLF